MKSYNQQNGVDYCSVVPTNLYGPDDNYLPENSHVIPALIWRSHEAKRANVLVVTVWGSGTPTREFLYVDNMAAASVHVMNLVKSGYDQHTQPMLSHINAGCGYDITIRELAETVARVIGYSGKMEFDTSRLDGAQRKLMDGFRLNALGWQAKVSLEEGLSAAYRDFVEIQLPRS